MSSIEIGYSATLEQFAPGEAVEFAVHAESRGFSGVMASDHFQPWLPSQGQSAFVWSVLAALAERTRGNFGPGVTTPTFRWHPAIVAQAAATLEAMYPGRFWLGVGSGEALNEHVLAQYWPEAPERINRMFEAVDIISKLFSASISGRDVKHSGAYFKLESTRLWTMPPSAPPIFVATSGPVTARRAGRVADGLITVGSSFDRVAMLLDKFDAGARDGGRDPKSLVRVLQLHLSWAPTERLALENALLEWPNGGMKFPKADIRSPFEFEQIARLVRPEDFEDRMVISADPDVHRLSIQRFADLGFDRIYLHNVGRDQHDWIDLFGSQVLPKIVR
ncbi:TIGR03557 family F420-dependent LLM class oxidoreductase [Leifsonia sp. NPDC056824]|uniref:TIGR03557 family F420-dependent LLM class oxidoreductase n=1 Tax=Leifsonia sp. NPDC056824 TaxID=3345953 RepID=UPI0036A300AC